MSETGAPLPMATNPLDGYRVAGGQGDLYAGADAATHGAWQAVAAALVAQPGPGTAQDLVTRQIQELGLAYRQTGDTDERTWPLTPMPLIVGAGEWERIEAGLVQRARLLDAVAADIYGPQRLVREGHLPPTVVTGSRFFAQGVVGMKPRGGHYVHVYAADLARGPDGEWRILADRLKLATGIGYALENRLAMTRSTGDMLAQVNARRLAAFYSQLRAGIARDCQRDVPRIALLTPGRFAQSYPEQAYLARYLGFPLVEGRDLTVSYDKLYVRTIAGPKRIDAVWRWIDTNALDPLAFDSHSQIGVPDLMDAWSRGGTEITNWPGVEAIESRAFAAFLPRLCSVVLGEAPLLPNVATWWCGQESEADAVRAGLDALTVAPAFDQAVEGLDQLGPVAGADMSGAERARLLAAIERRPMDYCGQEIVRLSTTPVIEGARIVARPFTMRVFVARTGDGSWTVMPGGFARLAKEGTLSTSLMGEGDISADVWVVDETPQPHHQLTMLGGEPQVKRGGGILASQAADNLFWLGRYIERIEATLRVVRTLLGSSIEVDSAAGLSPPVRKRLVQLLVRWDATDEAAVERGENEVCAAVLAETRRPGGVPSLFHFAQDIALGLRDRLSRNFSRLAGEPLPEIASERTVTLMPVVNKLNDRVTAMAGLIAENMVRGPAWQFLELGRRIERAVATCRFVRQLTAEGIGEDLDDALGTLLELADSQITYRSRYLTGPAKGAVLDLVLLDPDNPRSLVYQLDAIVGHIAVLPTLGEDKMPEPPLLAARAILAGLECASVEAVDDARLEEIEDMLLKLSDLVSTRYFLQYEKLSTVGPSEFLA